MENRSLYINITLFLILLILSLTVLKDDPEQKDSPYYNATYESIKDYIFILAILLVFFYIIIYINAPLFIMKYSSYYYSLLGLFGTIYGYLAMSHSLLFTYISKIVLIFILIIALAIIFHIFSNFFKSFKGITSFIVYLIFYIPCIVLDFVKYILKEYQNTSNPVLYLFVIELLLIITYLYIPIFIRKLILTNGIPILNSYVYLNQANIYPLNDNMFKDNNNLQVFKLEDKNTIRQNYAISLWLFTNDYNNSMAGYNKETTIFNYNNYTNGGNPKITYVSKDTSDTADKLNTYRFYFTNNDKNTKKTYYDIKLPSQKWNNIVFNYSSNHVNLFINGELIRTYYFKTNMPFYNDNDVITTGSDNNGISGAICNIRYYKKNLSQRTIINIYKSLLNKDPPITS